MNVKKLLLTIIMLSLSGMLFGALGPEVSELDGKQLKWEEGAWDYFIMFKSILENNNTSTCNPAGGSCQLGQDQPGNPQADACVDEATGTTFQLRSNHIPDDAHIESAYLIWTSGVPVAELDSGTTDNAVTLSFVNHTDNSVTHEAEITAEAHTLNQSVDQGTFTFNGYVSQSILKNSMGQPAITCNTDQDCLDNAQLGQGYTCLPSDSGMACGTKTGPYTYRVDISDFLETVHTKGREAGIGFDGITLYGDYTIKDLQCTDDPAYLTTSGMMGGWSIVLVYTSEQIRPKKIYMYDDFSQYRDAFEDINISGFELPEEAEIRVTLNTLEGDPGLYSSTFNNPEGLSISGAENPNWAPVFNLCNPQTTKTDPLSGSVTYTEVYNSNSSIYEWGAEDPTCIGVDPLNPVASPDIEYAMDVDTFYFNAENPPFNDHLKPGHDNFWVKVSANQDQVYTNFMILSIDTKKPAFDIPNEREKWGCSCADDSVDDSICQERPFWYLIKVQNWGEVVTNNVTVKDELPPNVKYVPGTAEMATELDSTGKGTNWESIPDSESGDPLPFAEGYEVSESMQECDKTAGTCEETVLIRFLVEPQNLMKTSVVSNIAEIADASGMAYSTNTSIPLRLNVSSTCPSLSECKTPSKEQCGGVNSGPECEKDEDCGDGYTCEDQKCVEETGNLSENAAITIAPGINTPVSESPIIIPNQSTGIVAGQFSVLSDKPNKFKFNALSIQFKSSNSIEISNIRIVKDTDGNGDMNGDEVVIGEGTELANEHSEIVINESSRLLAGAMKHNFVILFDAEYSGSKVPDDTHFNATIESASAFTIADAGTPEVTLTDARENNTKDIEFATYMFEPGEGFIFTVGENTPAITNPASINDGTKNIWQLKTKSINGGDTLQSVRINIYSTSQYVPFGDKIRSFELFLDADGNGTFSNGDQPVGTGSQTTGSYTFTNIGLEYGDAEVKYLLVRADFNMARGDAARFRIPESSAQVSGTSGGTVHGLPISSSEILFDCDPETDPDCSFSVNDDDGCSVAVVNNSDRSAALAGLALLTLLTLLFAGFRHNRNNC